ncbi:hypothetical protein OAO34_02190 [Candidatus Poseidoniaceae archaeon]|nr:hypothetical protein [Candidatus Poseidoniaceae archaeon]
MNEIRTRPEMEEDFLNITKAEIRMGQYDIEQPVVIVEGILDSKVFGKIRSSNLNVISIEKLIRATLKKKTSERKKLTKVVLHKFENKERVNLTKKHGVKELVGAICDLFIEKGFTFVFGIQDADKEGITNLIRSGKFESRNKKPFLFQTLPSRDIEMLLYSQLRSGDIFQPGFPKDFLNCTERANQLAFMGFGLEKFNKKKVIKGEYFGLKSFSGTESSNSKRYFESCISTDSIIDSFVEFYDDKFDQDSKEKLKLIVETKKEQLTSLNLHWSSLGRGHDLEKLLQYPNPGWTEKEFNTLMICLLDYGCLKDHKMFQSIEHWRKQNNSPRLFVSSKIEEE